MYKFEKLIVWQESLQLLKMIYAFNKQLPSNEDKNIKDQLRRATTSINLNIAEGSGSDSDIEFKRYLVLAKKSQFEVIALLKIINTLYNLDITLVLAQTEKTGKLLNGFIKKLKAKS